MDRFVLKEKKIKSLILKHQKFENLLKKHQIEVNRIICTNYARSLLDIDFDDLSKAGIAAIDNNNLNEVNVISKKINKLGFFEKLFHIFS